MSETNLKTNIIDQLYEISDLLEQQQASPFRVNAFRRAAETLAGLTVDIRKVVEQEGMVGLTALPHIGTGIGSVIYEIVATGRCSRLENLRGSLQPEQLFQTVPGVGLELARHMHEQLHVDTLESLEAAAHDGRLEQVEGVGPRRAAAIRAALATMLGRPRYHSSRGFFNMVSVSLILDVDHEYQQKVKRNQLKKITPKRFNPENEAWLPILHTNRGPWHFTALYSNTARAHELHKTHDWVVIYFYDDFHHENQHTVVTETHGSLMGKRVVRGREVECELYYFSSARAV